jgi:hypothetical protein
VLQQQRTCALRASSAACMRGPQPSLHDEGCDVVQLVKMKGRVACEISTCECLIATEAIFRGLFSDLTPAEAVSLLCSLVNQNKVRLCFIVHRCWKQAVRVRHNVGPASLLAVAHRCWELHAARCNGNSILFPRCSLMPRGSAFVESSQQPG